MRKPYAVISEWIGNVGWGTIACMSRWVGYNSVQEERLGINACDVNTGMLLSRFFGSSAFFGTFWYNYRQHTLVEPCFFLREYQKKLRNRETNYPQSFFLCGIVPHLK